MSWNKIEDHLFDEYCVEGEDKVLEQLMKEHDEELKKEILSEFITKFKKLTTDFLHIEDIYYYKEDIDKIIEQSQENMINTPIKMDVEVYYVFTSEQNDGYNSNHEYQFSSKEEFLKFVDGEKAIDRYGKEVKIGYYEHIEQAYTKGEIDIMALYDELNKNISIDENNLDEIDR